MITKNSTDREIIEEAKSMYIDDADIEIDGCARVSRSDLGTSDGAFVQAWVWVPYEEE